MLNSLRKLFHRPKPVHQMTNEEYAKTLQWDGTLVHLPPGRYLRIEQSHPEFHDYPNGEEIRGWLVHYVDQNGERFMIQYGLNPTQRYIEMKREREDAGGMDSINTLYGKKW